MNCKLCQKEFDAYREGRLPLGMKTQVESHLGECESCAAMYRLQFLAEKVIEKEKSLSSNPFLSTRVMARIENIESSGYKTIPLYSRILRPALITASLAAAIMYGILVGNTLQPGQNNELVPLELTLMDDAAIESVNMLSND